MPFPCTQCGACCRRVHRIADKFPHPILENGTCSLLTNDNKCKIYSERPEVCNVDAMYEKAGKQQGLNLKEYHERTAIICNFFIKQDRLDEKYLVKIDG